MDYVKNGVVRGLQRYRCKGCGCNFTATKPRGKPPAMKALAVLLYAMGNASFGMIARFLGSAMWRFSNGSAPRPTSSPSRRLRLKIGVDGKTFLTDEWEGFHRLILEDQLFTGKDLTPARPTD
jgi:hypothetical protein